MYYKNCEKGEEYVKNSNKYPVVGELTVNNFSAELIKEISLNSAEKLMQEKIIPQIKKTAENGGFACVIKRFTLPEECRNASFDKFFTKYLKDKGFNVQITEIEEFQKKVYCYYIYWI